MRNTGARREKNDQAVTTFSLSNPDAPPVQAGENATSTLPSAAFTWAYSDDAQLRASYAKTLSRPDFRELSPAPYLDPLLDVQVIGNPDLVSAGILDPVKVTRNALLNAGSIVGMLLTTEVTIVDKPKEEEEDAGHGHSHSHGGHGHSH